MRFYILDDLADPHSGKPLRPAPLAQVIERDGPAVGRCAVWCGRFAVHAQGVSETECAHCSRLWIQQGELSDGGSSYPIVDGIPRFVTDTNDEVDASTQESFGYEWEHFDAVLPEYRVETDNYFRIVPEQVWRDAVVLDAGCGMGRWAREVAKRPLRRLYAVDFSRAIDRAAATLADQPNAHCIQADVRCLPFRPAVITFSYCLGVLHHLDHPDAGMRSIDRVTRGPMLIYLYYALDNRPRFHRVLLGFVTALRRVTIRLPKRAMLVLSGLIAATMYWPLARGARLLERLGLARAAHQVPLSHYRNYSFRFMMGDAFDRFATPIERRYTRAEIGEWLARYGRVATFSDGTPFWVSLGTPHR
jgi:SAM-dependent methyltransferase